MFDIGFLELFVIAVMGLLVLGPERLPKVVKQLASWTAKSRHFANNLRDEFEREANLREMREHLYEQKLKFEQELDQVESDIASTSGIQGREITPEKPDSSSASSQAKDQ